MAQAPRRTPKPMFWVAAAGPIASVAIGLGCYTLVASLGWSPQADVSPSTAVLGWLGYINILLAAFNVTPGFPLDGGRILRAILWGRSGDADRATMTAARVGQAVAFGFILLGVMRFFGGPGFGGLWNAFIGWFLLQAAQAAGWSSPPLSRRARATARWSGVTRDPAHGRNAYAFDAQAGHLVGRLPAAAKTAVHRPGVRAEHCATVLQRYRRRRPDSVLNQP